MSLAAGLREPQPPPRAPRWRRWLVLGALEVGAIVGGAYLFARSGAASLEGAAKAVKGAEAALVNAARGSVIVARSAATLAPDQAASLTADAAAVERDQPLEERLRGAESLDSLSTVALATMTPPQDRKLERRWRSLQNKLPALKKSRDINRQNLTLAHARWQEAGRSLSARVAVLLKLANPPPEGPGGQR